MCVVENIFKQKKILDTGIPIYTFDYNLIEAELGHSCLGQACYVIS